MQVDTACAFSPPLAHLRAHVRQEMHVSIAISTFRIKIQHQVPFAITSRLEESDLGPLQSRTCRRAVKTLRRRFETVLQCVIREMLPIPARYHCARFEQGRFHSSEL